MSLERQGQGFEQFQNPEQIRAAINQVLLGTEGKIKDPRDIEEIEEIDNALLDPGASRTQLLRLLNKARAITENDASPPTIH